ncbi:MAG: hypothetical protein IKW08_04195 [Roseburia sp.]|nr:hypothetical protein [Roseburia sp.]
MEQLSKQKKKELKQFTINSKNECIIYLQNIIAVAVKCIENHKRYIRELESIVKEYEPGQNIPYQRYSDMQNKISNVESYLLNLFGDGQSISISYFKFRKLLFKLAKNNPDMDIQYHIMSEQEQQVLDHFNLSRNWNNHIPESLLTSEIEMIKQGEALGHSKNPIRVNIRNYVTYEYMFDLLEASENFHLRARMMLQSAKKDYSLLIGESVRIQKVYLDVPRDIKDMKATKLSAKVQGLPVDEIGL